MVVVHGIPVLCSASATGSDCTTVCYMEGCPFDPIWAAGVPERDLCLLSNWILWIVCVMVVITYPNHPQNLGDADLPTVMT